MINSVEEFRKMLGVGDQFWYITSFCCAPCRVEGPCTIISFEENENEWRVMFHTLTGGFHSGFISDLTNRWHGVFLTEEEAIAYFQERKNAYATDPVLMEEARRTRETLEYDARLVFFSQERF